MMDIWNPDAPDMVWAEPDPVVPERGLDGAGRGGAGHIPTPPWWRGSTFQVCGLWPWSVGIEAPLIGSPLGPHLISGAMVCCDPVSWFTMAKLINNPSVYVLGLPGYGKSTLIRRMITGMAAFGQYPLVLGDLKPDYVNLCREMEGQVASIGMGRGYLNPLDPGDAHQAAKTLRARGYGKEADAVAADARGRATAMVAALIELWSTIPVTGTEESVLSAALQVLATRHTGQPPILPDVLAVLRAAPDAVRAVTLDRGDMSVYQAETRSLELALLGLLAPGNWGEVFCRQSSVTMDRSRMVVYDISGIDEAQTKLQAATLLACWSQGFAAVALSQVLADCGLEPRRVYVPVQDEEWRVLRAGASMVDRLDAITRLNRHLGVGQIQCTHTMNDLLSVDGVEAKKKALGFVQRSGIVICGALPDDEMDLLNTARRFSQPEQDMLVSWQVPGVMDRMGRVAEPPGLGRFMIKLGGRPGIPIRVALTRRERASSDTNTRWEGMHTP